MLVGAHHAGFTGFKTEHPEDEVFYSGLSFGSGNCRNPDDGIILSKTSLTPEGGLPDEDGFLNYLRIGNVSSGGWQQTAPNLFGEPATPSGVGDTVVSHSPISLPPTGHDCAVNNKAPSYPLSETASKGNLCERRSWSCIDEDAKAFCVDDRRYATETVSRQNRSLSVPDHRLRCPDLCLNQSVPCLHTLTSQISDHQVCSLQERLRKQSEENQQLWQLLRDRDNELAAARAELALLRRERQELYHPTQPVSADSHVGSSSPDLLLVQVQGANEKLRSMQTVTTTTGAAGSPPARTSILFEGRCPWALAPAGPATGAFTTPSDGGPSRGISLAPSNMLLRQGFQDLHSFGPFSSVESSASISQPAGLVTYCPTEYQLSSVPETAVSAVTASVCSPSSPLLHSRSSTAQSAAPEPRVQNMLLLERERQRTDRAHAALLVSARQSSRLAEQLAVTKAVAVALKEELRDWRRVCLDNHKQLAALRRAAKAAAAAGAQVV